MNVPNVLSTPLRFKQGYKSISAIDSEIDDEFEFHIQCRTDELIASGIPEELAQQQARESFGASDKIKKQCQRINYGGQLWLSRLIVIGFVASLVAVGILTNQLMTLKDQNSVLANQLMASAASGMNSPAITSIVKKKEDLAGTVKDSEGKPIAGARVLLIYKNWARGYSQQELATKTNDKGEFAFKRLYSTDYQTAFLVSVVADGYVLTSDYVVNDDRKVIDPYEFELKLAVKKTLVLFGADGKPMKRAKVFPSARSSDGEDHMIYAQSAKRVDVAADGDGKVEMNFFAEGDRATIGIVKGGETVELKFKVNGDAEQTLGKKADGGDGKKADAGRVGTKGDVTGVVLDDSDSPIANANVLLVHKTWSRGYRQRVFKTKTDMEGAFKFPQQYVRGERYAFLVSIVADGWAMNSEYLLDSDGDDLDPFKFKMEKALAKTFIFQNESGEPVPGLSVFPSSRESEGERFMIYGQSADAVDVKTDSDGKATLSFFKEGDEAKIGVLGEEGFEIEVNGMSEQIISLKKSS
ncbi:MAG: permease prefix domain 1-containing protein [Mariniblastus sp.]